MQETRQSNVTLNSNLKKQGPNKEEFIWIKYKHVDLDMTVIISQGTNVHQ